MCITFFCLYPFEIDQQTTNNQQSQQKCRVEGHCQQDNVQSNDKLKHKIMKKVNKQYLANKISNGQEKSLDSQNQQGVLAQEKQKNTRVKFIIAFNRDEQSYRKTVKMGPFQEDPNIYAGRDLKSTGTWLGVNIKTAIMVILTNYDLPVFRPGKSRGQLVKSFLSSQFIQQGKLYDNQFINNKIRHKLTQVLLQSNKYSAFNLIVYNIRDDALFYICSETGIKEPLRLNKSQIYGLCNTDLFTLWPKTKHGISLFSNQLKQYKDENDQQIMEKLVNNVMRDNKSFSENPNDEASIFLQPFYSTLESAQRMTKSTFIALIKETKGGQEKDKNQIELVMRQITHKDTSYQQKNKNINKQHKQNEQYQHLKEFIVDYKFKL